MKVNDLKNKVKNFTELPTEKSLENEYKKFSGSLLPKLIPFVTKHGILLLSLFFSIFLYFIYSIFAHTKEVFITFLVVGLFYIVRVIIGKIISYNNDSESIIKKHKKK